MSKSTINLEALPQELMALVVNSTDAKGKPVLSAEDVWNLRSTNRCIQKLTFDSWAKRCFTSRKHIFSRASLQCLLDISNDKDLRKYVQEVAIGPEKVKDFLVLFLDELSRLNALNDGKRRVREEVEQQWEIKWGPTHKKVVEKQKKFDRSDKPVRMLEVALQGFPKLRHVRMDTYPQTQRATLDENEKLLTDEKWREAWGVKRILRAMG